MTLRLRSLREATKTDSKIIILDFRKARFSLFVDLFGSIPMGNCLREQRGAGELADFQGQSPQSRRTVLSSVQEDKQAWQKASVGEHGLSSDGEQRVGHQVEAAVQRYCLHV